MNLAKEVFVYPTEAVFDGISNVFYGSPKEQIVKTNGLKTTLVKKGNGVLIPPIQRTKEITPNSVLSLMLNCLPIDATINQSISSDAVLHLGRREQYARWVSPDTIIGNKKRLPKRLHDIVTYHLSELNNYNLYFMPYADVGVYMEAGKQFGMAILQPSKIVTVKTNA